MPGRRFEVAIDANDLDLLRPLWRPALNYVEHRTGLTALGGTVISAFPRFTVLADPEGNGLCLTEQPERTEDG